MCVVGGGSVCLLTCLLYLFRVDCSAMALVHVAVTSVIVLTQIILETSVTFR